MVSIHIIPGIINEAVDMQYMMICHHYLEQQFIKLFLLLNVTELNQDIVLTKTDTLQFS